AKKHPGVAVGEGARKERSKNGGVSLARRAAGAPPSSSCGQHRKALAAAARRIPERAPRSSRFPKCANPIIPWGSPPRSAQRHAEGASMQGVIAFILGNFTLTFFVLGLLASAIALWRGRAPRTLAVIGGGLVSFFLLFFVGFFNLFNFVFHVFFL